MANIKRIQYVTCFDKSIFFFSCFRNDLKEILAAVPFIELQEALSCEDGSKISCEFDV